MGSFLVVVEGFLVEAKRREPTSDGRDGLDAKALTGVQATAATARKPMVTRFKRFMGLSIHDNNKTATEEQKDDVFIARSDVAIVAMALALW